MSFSTGVWAQALNPCDLNADGVVNGLDVTLAINMALGSTPCTAKVEGPDVCTVITVQRVVNALLGQTCIVYNNHAAILTWTASSTTNVTYNVYRSASTSGPFTTPLNTSPITTTTYTDTTVQAGQTYYYVVTAIATSGGFQSADSNTAQGTIPSP